MAAFNAAAFQIALLNMAAFNNLAALNMETMRLAWLNAAGYNMSTQSVNVCCYQCSRWFISVESLREHYQNSPEHASIQCPLCHYLFITQSNLDHHLINKHNCCIQCNRNFENNKALEAHEASPFRHIPLGCPKCNIIFKADVDLDGHLAESHHYCVECRRFFACEGNLQTHLRSSKHKERTVPCPGMKCQKLFLSGAGLLNHLESGGCRSGANRHHVNALAVRYDKANVITNASRLLPGLDGYVPPKPPVIAIATASSFNGSQYECFLCHRSFKTLGRLNEHMQSPAHDAEIYRCPTKWEGCGAEFRTLSGLCQHVESEACGIWRFSQPMQDVIGDVAKALGKRLAL